MELMSLKCPHCGGNIKFVSASSGKCEHCGSTFVFSEGAKSGEGLKLDVFEYSIPFEPAIFFAEESTKPEARRLIDIFMGDELSPKRVERARTHFEIPDAEDIFMVMDTTVFNTGKVGMACCTSGIHMKDEDGELCFMSWQDFAKLREGQIRIYKGSLVLGKHEFILLDKDKKYVKEMFRDIWRRLQVNAITQ